MNQDGVDPPQIMQPVQFDVVGEEVGGKTVLSEQRSFALRIYSFYCCPILENINHQWLKVKKNFIK
jgi:hypothetical protein